MKQIINILTPAEKNAIYERYWKNCTIEDIASRARKTWDWANDTLNGALTKMRCKIETDPRLRRWSQASKYLSQTVQEGEAA